MVREVLGLLCQGVTGFNVTGLRHLEPLCKLAIIQITRDKLFPFDIRGYRVME